MNTDTERGELGLMWLREFARQNDATAEGKHAARVLLLLEAERAAHLAAAAERDRYESALVARHGGEPVELLRELDGARAELAALAGQVAGYAAVIEDARQESGDWIQPGTWVAIVMADPIYYGRIAAVTATHYYLKEASWVPDTGRAHAFAADPQSASEAAYIGDIAVERPRAALYRTGGKGKIDTK